MSQITFNHTQLKQTINTLSLWVGRDKIAQVLGLTKRQVEALREAKFSFDTLKERLHRELNTHLEADYWVDDTKITIASLKDANRHKRVILEQYSLLVLASKKGVVNYLVVASRQVTKDDILKLLKRANVEKGAKIQFDRFNRDLVKLGKLLDFTPIVKVKSNRQPYMSHVERQFGLLKKALYRQKRLLKILATENETLCLELITALAQLIWFNDPKPLLKLQPSLKPYLTNNKIQKFEERKKCSLCHFYRG